MKTRSDASDPSRLRRRILVACLIACTALAVVNLALMAVGAASQWTVVLFCVEASGVVSTSHALRTIRGQR